MFCQAVGLRAFVKEVVTMESLEKMAMYPTQKRYIKKVMRPVMVSFNRNTEPELVEWIEQQENKQGYIKQLIRRDMEEQNKSKN